MLKSNKETIKKRVLYAEAVYGQEEKDAVLKSLDNQWLASGPLVREFEEKVAGLFGKKYGVAVNSGSSANLLAIASLNLPKGSKVITPALTFATTVSELVLNRLVPVFIDGLVGRYTINEDAIRDVIDENTSAIMVPQLIGGICHMPMLRMLADKYNLKLIDDSCDTIAPRFGDRTVASYADVTTTSFYGSHIITACGVGGMLMTDDKAIYDQAVVLRDWGRVGNDKEDFESRFNFKIDGIPYDSKFLYSHLGYNLKMNEASAAFGLEQLKKLPGFLEIRKRNFASFYNFFSKYEELFHLPLLLSEATTNWLAFPLTIREDAPFTRYEFLKHLEDNGIQTRVLFSGNITRHPVYKEVEFEIHGSLENADFIMANGLLLGAHHGLTEDDCQYLFEKSADFLDQYDSKI